MLLYSWSYHKRIMKAAFLCIFWSLFSNSGATKPQGRSQKFFEGGRFFFYGCKILGEVCDFFLKKPWQIEEIFHRGGSFAPDSHFPEISEHPCYCHPASDIFMRKSKYSQRKKFGWMSPHTSEWANVRILTFAFHKLNVILLNST